MSVTVETTAEAPKPKPTCLVKMVYPAAYSLRGVVYHQGRVYEVSPATRDYLVGMGDGKGGLSRMFVDYAPPMRLADGSAEPLFTPLTEGGASELRERQAASPGYPEAKAVDVAEGGTFDTGQRQPARRVRSAEEAEVLLAAGRRGAVVKV